MHEWSIADSIVATLLQLVERGGISQPVKRVVIQVGKLVQIEKEILLFALRELSKNTPLEGTEFVLKEEDTVFRCNNCGYTWSWDDVVKELEREIQDEDLRKAYLESMHMVPSMVYAFNRCPRCGSTDFEIVKGFDLSIEKIETQ